MTTEITTRFIDLGQIGTHMPWATIFADLKYPMPYPEVVMAGELAYAQFTQMNSLLSMLAWAGDSHAAYTLTPLSVGGEAGAPEVYRLEVEVQLDCDSEAWASLGIGAEQLMGYVREAAAAWAVHRLWPGREVRSARVDEVSWTLMLPTASS